MKGAYDLSRQEIESLLEGQPAYRIRQVWRGLYTQGRMPGEMTELPAPLRSQLATELTPGLREESRRRSEDGNTTKWLWRLADGGAVETVLMRYPDRSTVCVSSQAGCAMGCSFCATGQGGFFRQLSTGEIVEQVVVARREALPGRLSNVVFMGMGEPLANYANVYSALERIHGELGLSARHLTVSTVGVVPGIRRLGREPLPVNLAVSLHAANDALRDSLVPLNRRYPIAALMDACSDYCAMKTRRLSFEWAMIDDVNDHASDARELASLARPLSAHVNLIPLNPTPGYPLRGSSAGRVAEFRDWLVELGVNATIRRNRGDDIAAACGQLAASERRPGSGTTATAWTQIAGVAVEKSASGVID